MAEEHTRQLALSWQRNAAGWTRAVREQRIDSRRLVTNAAVLEAVLALSPRRVLDIGCGEGWLCRALCRHGIETLGVDASAALIEAARAGGEGDYRICTYADLAGTGLGLFDLLVCNFALLDEDLQPLLHSLAALLVPGGRLLIQTVHPWAACGEQPYRDGWRIETFTTFGADFPEPMPWYFRTLQSWLGELALAGFRLGELREPCYPDGQPASLLLIAEAPGGR